MKNTVNNFNSLENGSNDSLESIKSICSEVIGTPKFVILASS